MKANELMIGDWVCVANSNVKISSVNYQGYAKYRLNECDIEISSDCLDCAEPIPLTEEILKDNGFEYSCNYDEWYKDGIPFTITTGCDYDGGCAMIISSMDNDVPNILVDSVHNLQNLLRICGISLADNFNIK